MPQERYLLAAHPDASAQASDSTTHPEIANAESTGAPSLGPSPFASAPAPWQTLYGDLGPDEIGREMSRVRSHLFTLELSERSIYTYLRIIWAAQLYCHAQDTTLAAVEGPVLAAWLGDRGAKRRAQVATALRHYWRFISRVDPPLDVLAMSIGSWTVGRPRKRSDGTPSPMELLEGDIAGDVGPYMARVRSALLADGLSMSSTTTYLRALWSAELWCRAHQTTLPQAPPSLLEQWQLEQASALPAKAATALRHFYRLTGKGVRSRDTERPPRSRPGHSWTKAKGEKRRRLEALRDALEREELATKTVLSYLRVVHRADLWCTKHGISLLEADAEHLAAYVATLPNTRSSRAALRFALKYYYACQGREDPPLWVIRLPRKPPMMAKPLEENEALALARAARATGGPMGAAVMIGLHLGLRNHEICKLRWTDFSGRWLEVVGKGSTQARLPVHAAVQEVIDSLPRRSEWLFPGTGRSHVSTQTLWNWVKAIAAEAGIEGVYPHRLRHTCLSIANERTGDLRAVQDFARHARPETTAGYTRVTRGRLVAVADAVGEELSGQLPAAIPTHLDRLAIGYLDLVRALEGPRHVLAWVALADILADRPGWTLQLIDTTLQWHHESGDRWATARIDTAEIPIATLWRCAGSSESDDVSWWERPMGALGGVLPSFESGHFGDLGQWAGGCLEGVGGDVW